MSPNIKRLTSVPYSNDDNDDDDDDDKEHDDVNIINKNKSSDEAFVNGHGDDDEEDNEKKEKDNDNDNWIVCPASAKSYRTINPIRAIVDPIIAEQQQAQAAAASSSSTMKEQQRKDDDDDGNKKKEFISLALGDPTANGNLPPCNVAIESIMNVLLKSSSSNNNANAAATGYVNACGTERARHAIAQYHSYDNVGLKVTPDNVIIANGCSGALELALTSLLDTDSVLLVPRPGFPLYEVIAKSHGAKVEHYNLLSNSNWECDLQHIQSIILKYRCRNHNNNTIIRGIVINNPSNPTGSVYSEQHLIDIISLANTNKLPIVADEIYGDLTYNHNKFYPLSFISAKYFHQHVPVITTSGLGKQFLLPGWRIGWIVFHDSIHKSLREVEAGTKRLAQVILGASNLCQQVIPDLLVLPSSVTYDRVSKWKYTLQQTLQDQALVLCNNISSSSSCTPGLSIIQPQGAMYAMIRINLSMFTTTTTTTTSTNNNKTTTRMIQNDVDFTKLLLKEENVFVLPGSAFGMDTRSIQHVSDGSVLSSYAFFRVVFCAPKNILLEATKRISNFCKRHTTCTTSTTTTTTTTTTEATTSMTPQTTLSD